MVAACNQPVGWKSQTAYTRNPP